MKHRNTSTPFPITGSGFLRVIERAHVRNQWRMAIEPSEKQDATSTVRTVFWRREVEREHAIVAHEYGRLIVTLEGWYHFDLEDLYQGFRAGWSWQQQIQEKKWCHGGHLDFLDELCGLFPVTSDALKARHRALAELRQRLPPKAHTPQAPIPPWALPQQAG